MEPNTTSRWLLHVKATIWRFLMWLGMVFHHLAQPSSKTPSFIVKAPSRLSAQRGDICLVFYVPERYYNSSDKSLFPVIINFHGGGFTLGTGTDDARWARCVVEKIEAVFVSVEYRLAPKYPFSVAGDDGTDALIYLAAHADELRLDPHKIILGGFSAGANLALTIPFIFYDLKNGSEKRFLRPNDSDGADQNDLSQTNSPVSVPQACQDSPQSTPLIECRATSLETLREIPPLTICAIIAFYPPTDFRIPRATKRTTNPRPELNISAALTNLFDDSYLSSEYAATSLDLGDPYLSPAAASDDLLRAAYPQLIILQTCEHDMLNVEGVAFGEKLKNPNVGKTVKGGIIENVPHAFDKMPNPMKYPEVAERVYGEVCAELIAAGLGSDAHQTEWTQPNPSKTCSGMLATLYASRSEPSPAMGQSLSQEIGS
ncbi:hypothetical protein V502_07310 [Pseudogymnoascus sp. VKM F-4520 (FW-2644)]|nr:hypothetical protein V502_07310 [Pseudogymnoascus sp. VKM F-4520 (FW-2644)]